MPGVELFLVFTRPLDELGIQYLVTGAVASIIYGEPRMTHDIDLVLDLDASDAATLAAATNSRACHSISLAFAASQA